MAQPARSRETLDVGAEDVDLGTRDSLQLLLADISAQSLIAPSRQLLRTTAGIC
jgi:hypothetical protein